MANIIQSINPANGAVLKAYDEMTKAETDAAIRAADDAYLVWREVPISERAKPMRKLGQLLRDRAAQYGALMAAEMGKPLKDGIAEAQKCAMTCDFYADNAEKFLAHQNVDLGDKKAFVAFRPLGVVLAIMPWNFPFWQVIRFAAPTLMAGNAALLKHALNVPGCALALEQLFHEAGFPDNLFRTLLVHNDDVRAVIEHRFVRAVSLTGSGRAGRAVASQAGGVLKKCVLELGGSDAYLVLEGCDIAFTAAACAKGRLVNDGQSCVAAKRFIVVEALREAFERQLVIEMQKGKMGDPMDDSVTLGPMARIDLRDELHKQVRASIKEGARLLCGGTVPAGAGAFYPPTVLTNVKPGMPAYHEELFGPVASVISAKDNADAVRIANDNAFGLGGGVFTPDLALAEKLAVEGVEAGQVFVNGTVVSDPRLPFGGIKESGYGRELSHFGIHEFVNIKTVVIAKHGV